ncbi:MAG: hypothetical protein IT162_08940 [Bryobacterales bacterium]|nr:hypothetical protein [Bryobacterales bacterium]
MSDFKIPDDHRKAFARLARIESSQFESIRDILNVAAPCLHLTDLQRRVREAFLSVLPDDPHLGDALVALGTTASRLEFGSELSGNQVLNGVASTVTNAEGLGEHERSVLLERLTTLASLPVLRVSSKSTALQLAHSRVFTSSKIITDLRPVFGEPVDGADPLFMVIHQLQITSLHNDGKEEIFFAMDDRDLERLGEMVSRARSKAAQLRQTLKLHRLAEIDGGAR